MAPPEGPRGKRRAAAPTTPAPRRPGTWGAGGPAEGGAEEESRRRDRRASAPAPARPGEAGPAENCVEERARGQLMLDLVSKNGNRDSKTHRISSLLPPWLIVASSLLNGGCGGCTPAGGGAAARAGWPSAWSGDDHSLWKEKVGIIFEVKVMKVEKNDTFLINSLASTNI